MILKGVFDVFVLAETKIDGAFPSSQFCIKGDKMFCKDRNRFGGSLIVYIRRGLITRKINHLEGNYIESIVLLVQPGRSSKWTLFLYTYEPPNVTKNLWKLEFNSMLFNGSQRHDNLAIVRDLNCDISHLNKGFREGRTLRDSMRHKAVSDYFRTTAVNAKCRPKIFWQTVKPFMHSKKNISRDSIHLKEGDSLIVNKLEVAQIFSAHFSSFPKDIDSHGR